MIRASTHRANSTMAGARGVGSHGMLHVRAALIAILACCAAGCAPDTPGSDGCVRQPMTTDPDTPGPDGCTLLVEAIGEQDLVSVQTLLDRGADPNRPGGGGETPVHAAAFVNDPAFLQAILAHGGDPNVRNPVTGGCPLEDALLSQNVAQHVKLLLKAGADPDLADRNHNVPLHTAARTNSGAAILLLLEAGAAPEAKNSGGASFQTYYFSIPRNALNARALAERRQIVAWLKAHDVPLDSMVEASY